MRPFHVCALSLITLACPLVRFEYDPHAVAPSYDRWEAIVPASADSAYAGALAVVIESGYTVAAASRADGVLDSWISGTAGLTRRTMCASPSQSCRWERIPRAFL
jgi:hypothetical protein